MRQIEMNATIETFQLGPFTVLCQPYFREQYTRYTILANGVPIRDQITYPEEADGWLGLREVKTDYPETMERLQQFREALAPRARQVKDHHQIKLQKGK